MRRPLECSQEQFEALHAALDIGRDKSPAKVDRVALAALLRDHAAMLAELNLRLERIL